MILHRLLQILTGVLLGLAVLALLYLRGPGNGPDRLADPVAALDPDPYPAPELTLRDPDGRTVRLEHFRGEVALVFFGFANCPDICPLTLARWSRALETLEGRGGSFQGIFVSVDPVRDTPAVLRRWVSFFHPSFLALTGSPDEIATAATAWNVHVRVHREPAGDPHAHHRGDARGGAADLPPLPDPPAPGDEDWVVEHSSRTFVVNREGRVVRTFPAYLEAEEIVTLLDPLMAP